MLRTTIDGTAPAAEPKPHAFSAGAALVWKRQRILWWIFVVNLVLAFIGAHSLAHSLAENVLNSSLESARRLVHGFDVSALEELGTLPNEPLRGMTSMSIVPSILFTLFMLFMTGGILASYYEDARLDASAFFEACGRFFWRFVRLLIYFAIVMIPIVILASIAGKIYDHIDDGAVSPLSAPIFMAFVLVFILFLLLCARLWFDMAQVLAVVNDERTMARMLRQSAALLWHNFGSLFWLYLRINVIGWVIFFFGLYVWMMLLPPEATTAALFLAQFMIQVWLAARLWQRAAETAWYKQYRLAQFTPVPVPPAVPVEIVPPEEILPETD